MRTLIEDLYEVAAHADLLTPVRFGSIVVMAEFRLPDTSVLDGLALSHDPRLRYPASYLPTLVVDDEVEIAGSRWRVRSIKAIGDGSEIETTLSPL